MTISTQPRVDSHWEVQQRKNAVLRAGERRQMIPPAAPLPDDRQR
jgi:hypothetical protein